MGALPPQAAVSDDTLSSSVSPGACDLRWKWTSVQQLGSGTLDYEAWLHAQALPMTMSSGLEGGYKPRAWDSDLCLPDA